MLYIVIIGLIIVILMVITSTKIKKSAKAAFEPETFENEAFTIMKPDGFIIPFNEKSPYSFEAYSKDFGDDEAAKLNQCQAVISVKNGFQKNSSTKTKKNEKDVLIHVFTKRLGSKARNKTYELEVSVLDDYRESFAEKIEMFLNSFALK